MEKKPLQWFIDRIGKTTYYKNKWGCIHSMYIDTMTQAGWAFHLYQKEYHDIFADTKEELTPTITGEPAPETSAPYLTIIDGLHPRMRKYDWHDNEVFSRSELLKIDNYAKADTSQNNDNKPNEN